uniref:PQQ_3 domain-containing protein n=1 Tax=Angiostrongylus cantonensis TaxID=6313 RepID=A0A0K0D6P6_ANGCA
MLIVIVVNRLICSAHFLFFVCDYQAVHWKVVWPMSRFVVLIGAAVVTFCAVLIGISAFNQEDGIITDENFEAQQLEPVPVAPESASHGAVLSGEISTLGSINYLYVSTMDGKLHALDAMNGGKEVWLADFDSEALLQGTLGRMQPMKVDGRVFKLIPALDGTLYIYTNEDHILEPIPISTDMLLQVLCFSVIHVQLTTCGILFIFF